MLQHGNRTHVPKYVRWYYKLEPTQILEASIRFQGVWRFQESFLCRMTKDGRFIIPQLLITMFADGKPTLHNHIAEITLAPA
jgi:hypothetical protein